MDTEEAFLFSSLREVVKVWSKGCGKASLTVEVVDGTAELRMSFSLGHPMDPHVPSRQTQVTPATDDINPGNTTVVLKNRKKRKSPSKLRRDQARASAFRRKKLILPITGKLLPVRGSNDGLPVDASSSEASTFADTPPVSLLPPNIQVPVKQNSMRGSCSTEDIGLTRKNLFPASDDVHPDESSTTVHQNYRQKEEALWSKLFD